jgi:hypothetical protein
MRILATMLMMCGLVAGPARGEDTRCMYAQEFFSAGAVSCQAGMQFRCVEGTWKATGLDCADTRADDAEPDTLVDPRRTAPPVREPSVQQPGQPTVNPD